MEEKDSLLANLFASKAEEVREEILLTPIEELLRQEMESVGIYVFNSDLDYVNGNDFAGTITVATDGMPERAKAAVEEVLRAQGIEEDNIHWRDWAVPGQLSVIWEVLDGN